MHQSKVSGWESEGLKVKTKSQGTAAESSESSEDVIHSLSPPDVSQAAKIPIVQGVLLYSWYSA